MTRRRRLILALLVATLIVGMLLARQWYVGRVLVGLDLPRDVRVGEMPEPNAGERILIFAPHEDDETLGCAGYIQRARRAGASVHIVLLTNGEYPELDVVLFEDTLRMQPQEFIHLGYMRQKETLAAMGYLGLHPSDVTFLGYPNQYLNQMWLPAHWLPSDPVQSKRTRSTRSPYSNSLTADAVYCGQSALADVEMVLSKYRPDAVITLHPNDLHVDHWPTGAIVRFALMELAARGEEFARNAKVYTYLIHRDPWPAPRGYHPGDSLLPPSPLADIGQTDWLILPLTDEEISRKHKATALYKTQGGSIDRLLLAFSRANELFGETPISEWPGTADVPRTEVIRDPIGDLKTTFGRPQADIRLVTLDRQNGKMFVRVETLGAAKPSTCYRVSIHAGGVSPSDRVIVEYAWTAGKPTGRILAGGEVRTIDPSAMRAEIDGNTAVLEADSPLTSKQTFFMIRAWTTKGKKVIDQTATQTLLIGDQ